MRTGFALFAAVAVGLAGCDTPSFTAAPVGELDLEREIPDLPPLWDGNDTVPYQPTAEEIEAAGAREGALAAEAATTHFINFSDGTTTLTKGSDNATLNRSQVCGATPYPKYTGTDSAKKSLIASMARITADYNIVLVTKRPTSGDYSMEMVGPQGNGCSFGGGVLGIAPMDCKNYNKHNISFTFGGGFVTTAQESGHAFGLEHVDVACDVMGAGYSGKGCPGGVWKYPDVDGKILGGASCGSATQNSHKRMLAALGMWPGGTKPDPWTGEGGGPCMDMKEPTLTISEPADGATVGADFKVRGTAMDDCMIKNIHIKLTPADIQADAPGPAFDWMLTGISGMQTIELTAEDASGKKTVKTITVKAPGGDGGGSGGSGGAGGGSGGSGGGNGGGGSGGGSGNGNGGHGPKVGSGCAVGAGSSSGVLSIVPLALAVIAGFRGRRRRR